MAAGLVEKVKELKSRIRESAEPRTLLKVLRKLEELDITLEVLAETGIGKVVNSLRRHGEAGKEAKVLVSRWKALLPRDSSHSLSERTDAKRKPSRKKKAKEAARARVSDGGRSLSKTHLRTERETPGKSFEACLSYDLPKRKKTKTLKSGRGRDSAASHSQAPPTSRVLDLLKVPLPVSLAECEDFTAYQESPGVSQLLRAPERGEVSADTPLPIGQRLRNKMQVYSGSKISYLPAMMTLFQQCVRTLQNNLDSLCEVGGVPFEILEPVLERCTPEQLLRIEECNPVFIGVTDELWERHCWRDFREARLQEYEAWRELYLRLHEERERKLQRLTRSIVSHHSGRPAGRRVKMAFIHSAAKPPRSVRIQQEIHGTAVLAPPPSERSSGGKHGEGGARSSFTEPPKASPGGSLQPADPRRARRVAPMMAKSLKAFRKQLNRR